jgi:dipeptidyl aminopeptidase/acylaminoacyl peptidase
VPVVAVRPRPQADPLAFDEPARAPVRARRDDDYYDEPRRRPFGPFQGPTGAVNGLGTAALVIGIIAGLLALFFGCFGVFITTPLASLGLVLGGIGMVLAFMQKRGGYGMPIAGSILSFVAIVISLGPWLLLFIGLRNMPQGPGAPSPNYVEAGKDGARLGDIRVEVREVARVNAPTGGEQLAVRLGVENLGDKQIPYTRWAASGATLTDQDDRALALRPVPLAPGTSRLLRPREDATDVLYFDAPGGNPTELRLTLPGKNVAYDKDAARFRIPRDMIRKLPTGPVVWPKKPLDKKPLDKGTPPVGEPEVRRERANVPGARNALHGVAMASDGQHLLGCDGGHLYLYDLEAGSLRKTIDTSGGTISVAISPDGKYIVSGSAGEFGSEMQPWDVIRGMKNGKAVKHDGGHIGVMLFSPNGANLAAATRGHMKGSVRVWQFLTGRQVGDFPIGSSVYALAWSSDSARLLSGGRDKLARLWEVGTGRQEKAYEGHTGPVTHVSLSSGGDRALTASMSLPDQDRGDGTLRVWDRTTGNLLKTVDAAAGGKEPTCAAFSADAKRALVGYRDGEVALFDLDTGRKLIRYQKHTARVGHVLFVPGKPLAVSTGGDFTDKLVRIWDLP